MTMSDCELLDSSPSSTSEGLVDVDIQSITLNTSITDAMDGGIPNSNDARIVADPVSTAQNSYQSASDSGEERDLPSPVTGPRFSETKYYVLLAAVFAALGGLLFGYDIGIISGALLQLKKTFNLSCGKSEFVVSAVLVGALIAACFAGSIVDRFGRRLAVIGNAVFFIAGSILLACSINFSMLIVGRLMIGFAVALSAIAECIYISEISPFNKRGFLVSLNEFSITVGFLLAYLVDFAFIGSPNGWRYMFGLGGIFAVIQGVGMVFMPPSPRYLMLTKKYHEAHDVLVLLRPEGDVNAEIREMEVAMEQEQKLSTMDLCRSKDNMINRMFIGIGLVIFQQITGQPNVLYYAPTIFQLLGFGSARAATLATVILGIVKVVFTGFALFHLDKFGRRKILIGGASVMMISILTLGIVTQVWKSEFVVTDPCPSQTNNSVNPEPGNKTFSQDIIFSQHSAQNIIGENTSYDNISPPEKISSLETKQSPMNLVNYDKLHRYDIGLSNISLVENGTSTDKPPTKISRLAAWVTMLALMMYVGGFAVGFGPGVWLVLSEIFPANIRGRAMAFAQVFNWLPNLIITTTFLDTMSAVGVPATFLTYGVLCGASIVFIFIFVPETKDKSLEEINSILQEWSVIKQWRETICCKKTTNETVSYHPIQPGP